MKTDHKIWRYDLGQDRLADEPYDERETGATGRRAGERRSWFVAVHESAFGNKADIQVALIHVRFWGKADINGRQSNVCF
jgi:hypothetical protein